MAKILDMPKLSPTMEEGQLASWHKDEGAAVDIDDLLAEVETDKATMEFRSFDRGTLLKILVPAGSVVKLGQPVAILGNAGEDISALVAQAGGAAGKPAEASKPAPEAAKPASAGETRQPVVPPNPASAPPDVASGPAPNGNAGQPPSAGGDRGAGGISSAVEGAGSDLAPASTGRVKASPYVRKLARERDLDLHTVRGSGPNGRVVARDLATVPPAQARGGSPAPSPPPAGGGLRAPKSQPLSMMRKAIARRLTESKQTVPHFYLTIDVDAGALVALRERVNGELAAGAAKGEAAEKVSLNDLIIKACAAALVAVPECNAQFSADAILYHTRVDISVAVAVPDGLITPVLRDADKKGLLAVTREVRELAARAKEKKLAPAEMSDGTFSISNLGMFGIDEFAAVINPPEGAILAVGRVRDEPIVREGAVVAGKRLAMTLSCDHRVVDGAVGARFLAELRRLIEQPMRILIG